MDPGAIVTVVVEIKEDDEEMLIRMNNGREGSVSRSGQKGKNEIDSVNENREIM